MSEPTKNSTVIHIMAQYSDCIQLTLMACGYCNVSGISNAAFMSQYRLYTASQSTIRKEQTSYVHILPLCNYVAMYELYVATYELYVATQAYFVNCTRDELYFVRM